MNILVTGCAGFIGFHLCANFLKKKYNVIGIDNLNNYYSTNLKKKRLSILRANNFFKFKKIDISDQQNLSKIFKLYKFDIIFNLAAQPGVRYSFIKPNLYLMSNIVGFFNLIECAKKYNVKKIIYASSSSVYGNSKKLPCKENQIKHQESFYAFSKYSNEQLAELYSRIHNMNFIGLRFFTIFGEWGRPDMFVGKLINACIKNKIFYLNNFGNHKRDFTYIGDAISMINKIYKKKFTNNHIIFNICSSRPVLLYKIISIFKKYFDKINIVPTKIQKGDVFITHGSNFLFKQSVGKIKITKLSKSLGSTIAWYKNNQDFNESEN